MKRVVSVAGVNVAVFDTALGLASFVKRTKGDCTALVRNKKVFIRRDGAEMTVQLNATDNPQNRHLITAATSLADEAEKLLSEAA